MSIIDRTSLLERNRRIVDLAAALVGVGFGATLGLAVTAESRRAIAAPGGISIAIGRVAGLSGAYLLLVMVLLMTRIPALERSVGQDRLALWHRRIGAWPVVLIAIHVAFITLGYAQSADTGTVHQAWIFIDSYPDVLAAAVGFALLVFVSILSIRIARSRLRYETWWAVHLYVYLALALAFAHQIVTGASFVGHPLTRIVWTCAWVATIGTALSCRVGLPAWRSLRHRLRVVAVRTEAPGVISIVCSGHHLERLSVEGGQFFQWRFLAKGLWWQAHPYSLSALPAPPYLRVTIRASGDYGRSLASLSPGTRIAIEGPYGAFTSDKRHSERVLLVGAGVGVTPLRAILEDLPPHVDTTVIVRASSPGDLVLHEELTGMVRFRGGQIHEVIGPRHAVKFDVRMLRTLVPDVSKRDVYICGPEGFADSLVSAAQRLGVPEERIHREQFAF
jgi:predicted ferric reductase